MREVREISIEQIHPNRHQPRLEFNEDALMELAQSIRENGLIQPITVREDEDGYEIIAGERRYKACILAGYSEVPCNVMSADEQKLAELALVENIQRENLTSIEEAKAYIQIMRSAGMTQEELAAKMGKSQSTIANKVRLLNLPDDDFPRQGRSVDVAPPTYDRVAHGIGNVRRIDLPSDYRRFAEGGYQEPAQS